MDLILLTCFCVLSQATVSAHRDALMAVTISPNLWDLLDTRADVIKNAVTSTKIPDIERLELSFVHLKCFEINIKNFHVDKSHVFFKQMDDGIHIRVEEGELALSANFYAGILDLKKGTSDGTKMNAVSLATNKASFDIILKWDGDDFKFIPFIAVNMNLKIVDKRLMVPWFKNYVLSHVDKFITERVDTELPKRLNTLISEHLNPQMGKLKELLAQLGFKKYRFEWMVEEGALRLIIGHKSDADKLPRIKTSDAMICMFLNSIAKRNLIRLIQNSRPKRENLGVKSYGIELSCVDQEVSMKRRGLSLCTDIDFDLSSDNVDRIVDCEPDLDL